MNKKHPKCSNKKKIQDIPCKHHLILIDKKENEYMCTKCFCTFIIRPIGELLCPKN